MDSQKRARRNVRCRCGYLAGTCARIECPHQIKIQNSDNIWVEGWALSKYSSAPYRKTPIGSLIKKIKYGKSPYYSLAKRTLDAKYISDEIVKMIKWLYDPSDLPFDLCICPPSHQTKPLDLPDFICRKISGGSIKYVENALTERIPLTTIKAGPKHERGPKLRDNFILNAPANVHSSKGILIIDDVFDTGSTITGVSRAVSKQLPQIPQYVITAAYIGHMGRVSAI